MRLETAYCWAHEKLKQSRGKRQRTVSHFILVGSQLRLITCYVYVATLERARLRKNVGGITWPWIEEKWGYTAETKA